MLPVFLEARFRTWPSTSMHWIELAEIIRRPPKRGAKAPALKE
jgi:hypothetical protein